MKQNIAASLWDYGMGEVKKGHSVVIGETGAGKTLLLGQVVKANIAEHVRVTLQKNNNSKTGKDKEGRGE